MARGQAIERVSTWKMNTPVAGHIPRQYSVEPPVIFDEVVALKICAPGGNFVMAATFAIRDNGRIAQSVALMQVIIAIGFRGVGSA
jgi:hypothetical protein